MHSVLKSTTYNSLKDYYNTTLLRNRPILKKEATTYHSFSFVLFYRETYVFSIAGACLKVTKKKGLLHQVIKIKCHVTYMDFFLNIPIQMPLLSKW